MTNMGIYPIFFKGSNRTYKRVVYEDCGRYFCRWYGEKIEVVRGMSGYFQTVECY